MKLLILGDIMGSSGRSALKNKLPKIITENKIDFVIVNVKMQLMMAGE